MADDSGARAPVIHRTKLFGGRETAEEVHAKHVWRGKRCNGCRSPKIAIEIRVSILVKDLRPEIQSELVLRAAAGLISVKPFQTPSGPALRWSTVYACRSCQATAERAAARGAPSYALVHIDRGVGADQPIVAVPR